MSLTKKLTSLVVTSGLVLSLIGSASAASYTPGDSTGAQRMEALKLIEGVPGQGLALDANIKRSEFVTIVVRAFGQEGNAKYLKGANSYPDVSATHWASGYIAMAKNLIEAQNQSMGNADGTFNPDGTLTAAQAVTFLLKFMGVQPDSTKAWPDNYLTAAVSAGIITTDDSAAIKAAGNAPATRGQVFFYADNAFANYKYSDGSTVYTKYVVTKAPTVTVDQSNVAPTTDTAFKVTGKVAAGSVAVDKVYVNDQAVTLGTDGSFEANVNLAMGDNTITVSAKDIAGTQAAPVALKVTRTVGVAATITASDITVAAGGTATVTAAVSDANGTKIDNAVVTGTVSATTLGTYENGTFKAGTAVGTGTLTLTSGAATKTVNVTVSAGDLAKITPSASSVKAGAKVTFTAADANGNAVTGGITYAVDSNDALIDTNSGALIASKPGTYTVTATKGSTSVTAKVGVFDAADAVTISTPSSIIANDGSKITVTATVVDENGNVVTNYDKTVKLEVSPANTLSDASTSADNALTGAKVVNGVATFIVKTNGTPAGQILKLTATSTNDANITGTSTLQAVPQVATSVDVTASTYVDVRSATPSYGVTADVLDQDGKAMKTGAWQVDFSVAGSGLFSGVNKTTTSGYYSPGVSAAATVNVPTGVTGDLTVTATVGGVGSGNAVTHGVVATDAKSYVVSVDSDSTSSPSWKNTVTLNVKTVDANGVPVSGVTTAKVATSVDSSSTKLAQVTLLQGATDLKANNMTLTNGAGSFTFNAAKLTGPVTLTVSDPNSKLTSGTVTLNLVAGPAFQIAWDNTSGIYLPSSAPSAVVTAQLQDEKGNAVAQATDLTVTSTNGADQSVAGVKVNGTDAQNGIKVTTDATGKLSLNVAVPSYVTKSYKLALSQYNSNNIAQAGNAVLMTVADTVASNISVQIVKTGTSTQTFQNSADLKVQLVVTVKDSFGTKLLDQASYLSIHDLTGLYDGTTKAALTTSPTFSLSTDKYVSQEFYIGKAGSISLQVDDSSAPTTVTGTASVLATAGAIAKATVAQADSSKKITVTSGAVSGPFTVQLADQFGNAVVAPATVTLTFTATAPTAGKYIYVRTSSDGASVTTSDIATGNATKTIYVLTNDSAATLKIDGTYTTKNAQNQDVVNNLTQTSYTFTGF